MATLQQLATSINDLSTEVRPDSIPPSRVAGILSSLLEILSAASSSLTEATTAISTLQTSSQTHTASITNLQTEMAKKPDLDANGKLSATILKGAIPEDVLKASSIARYIITFCWQYALGETYDNENYMYPETGTLGYTLQRNGYFPNVDAEHPYFLHGCRLNAAQALKVMVDHWTPLSHGMATFEILTHLPMAVYEGNDIGAKCFNFDMMHARRSSLRNIILHNGRIDYYNSVFSKYEADRRNETDGTDCNAAIPCVYPTSMYRAFDGASALEYIHGGIDCRFLTQKDFDYTFRGCASLNKLRLFNIPDSVSVLDFHSSPKLWPVLLHQLTFWHNGKSYAGRSSSLPPLEVRLNENLVYEMRNWPNSGGEVFESTYGSYSFKDWKSLMIQKRINIRAYTATGQYWDDFIVIDDD